MLAEKGQPVTLSRATAGTRDPDTGVITPDQPSVQTVLGVALEYSTFLRQGSRNEPGSLILSGDKQLLLAPKTTTGAPLVRPAANDQAVVDGVTFTITAVAPLSPAGTPVLFDCNIRGAA